MGCLTALALRKQAEGLEELPGGGGEGLYLWGGAQLIEAGVRGRNPTTLTEDKSPEE